MIRTGLWAALALGLIVAAAGPLSAQPAGTIVGLVGGAARSNQIWRPDAPTEAYTGFTIGVFADVPTPLPVLSVRAEGAYTRRGGDVTLEVGGEPARGRLRTSYLTMSVHARLSRDIGPLQAYLALGPTLEQVMTERLDALLAQVLDDQQTVVFSMVVGGGVGAWVAPRVYAGADVRILEGLSDAYAGSFTDARHRSVEARLMVGVPLDLIRRR